MERMRHDAASATRRCALAIKSSWAVGMEECSTVIGEIHVYRLSLAKLPPQRDWRADDTPVRRGCGGGLGV
jgi:hypothetical protein